MGTATKRMNIFRVLFGSGIDVEDYENVTLPRELQDAQKAIEARATKIKSGFNSATKGGFAKKIDPKTEEAMRAMHNKVTNKVKNELDREIGG